MTRSKIHQIRKPIELSLFENTSLCEEFPSFQSDITMDRNFKELPLLIEGVSSSFLSYDKILGDDLQEDIQCLMEYTTSSLSLNNSKKVKKKNKFKHSDSDKDLQTIEMKVKSVDQKEMVPINLPVAVNDDKAKSDAVPLAQTIEDSIPNLLTPIATEQDAISPKKEKNTRLSNHEIARILEDNHDFAVINQNLHYWEPTVGHFIGLAGEKSDLFVRQNIPNNLKNLITARSIDEIIKWLTSNRQLVVPEETLTERKNYISFKNGVVSVKDLSLYEHSPEFCFTSVVDAEYPLKAPDEGEKFEEFMEQVTGGSQADYLRLQELFGYVLSEIRDVKIIPFLIGPKDSGKSIALKLLGHMVGEEYSSSLSLEQMNQPDYLCQLFGKKLNTCGEISEIPLKRLDTLKKLSGGDPLMARYLYAQPIKFVNQAALLFAGNLLPVLKGIDRSNAFIERLEIFPFEFQVPKEKQDIHLFEKLLTEKSYIAWWSLQGLRRWISNNYQFTKSESANKVMQDYKATDSSIENFIEARCTLEQGVKEHNSVLYKAYQDFCKERELVSENTRSFHRYMQQTKGLKHYKFRKNGLNENGYAGIQLKNEGAHHEGLQS